MKQLILTLTLLMTMAQAQAKNDDKAKVVETVESFAKAAEHQSTSEMNLLLDDNFRVVMNQLFGSDKVTVMDKTTYLNMLGEKKLGGDKAVVKTESINVNGNNAVVNTVFKSDKMSMRLYLLLAKDVSGIWKIVSDLPTIE